ncbi:hypothetical protein PQU92_15640 [Asticcacaulis sp. BYS171W]|uniref:Uncharacterized protein n=1 Tax=Asticcacaulis aquaticus TaxID=2984212 RepID=A0ABT5HXB5_9CAUL|nr:hypothetical protein [Asticcacaulis aquaticus]MDC7684717.1 hypothetical protein [Asticcacaulis aquaticus]
MYRNQNYAVEVSSNHDRKLKRRNGYHEFLLCRGCEDIIDKYENEATRLRDGINIYSRQINKVEAIISGLDYRRFKLFQLSILWRMGVSNLDLFKAVQLGPHQEAIRQMVYHGNPGEIGDFGCAIGCATYEGKLATTWVIPPEKSGLRLESNGIKITKYIVHFGGFHWHFYVAPHSKMDNYIIQYFLQKDGTFRTSADNILTPEVRKTVLALQKRHKHKSNS